MCLAIPMRVIERKAALFSDNDFQIAIVNADGIQREVRLDIVDRMPDIGDYLIVHAGFAIHTLDPEEAEKNLDLLRQLAETIDN